MDLEIYGNLRRPVNVSVEIFTKGGGHMAEVRASPNHWLTEKEVSMLTGISTSTLQKQRFRGKGIPYCKVGTKSVRYSFQDVVDYMDSQKIETSP